MVFRIFRIVIIDLIGITSVVPQNICFTRLLFQKTIIPNCFGTNSYWNKVTMEKLVIGRNIAFNKL